MQNYKYSICITIFKNSTTLSKMFISRIVVGLLAALCVLLPRGAAFSATSSILSSFRGISNLKMVAVGAPAPDFSLSSISGKVVKLSSFKGKKPVVIFFYPADNTPGCTKEACAFERKAPDFKALGAEVFGISSGKKEDKEKFIRTNKLNNIELLIDSGDVARKAFDVPKALFGVLPGRVTYVIGKDGKVLSIYDDLANAENHPVKALATLNANKPTGASSGAPKKFGLF
jgi:peroxiredoxin Q/BCP